MKKKFLKRAAAFAVASLMAVGVITVLPDECLPQIGSVVSAEETEAGGVAINEANFPDEVFRQYVSDNFDNDNNGYLSDSEVNSRYMLDIYATTNNRVKDFKGIEYLTALTYFSCDVGCISALDISNNKELTYLSLYCNGDGSQLKTLDVSNNVKLKSLHCFNNPLTQLDVSNNLQLTDLDCSNCKILSLDLSNNKKLKSLSCYGNQLESLDLSQNTELETLACGNNKFSTVDVSKNIKLKTLDCNCSIISISSNGVGKYTYTYYGTPFTTLDISNNIELTSLYCSENILTELDVSKNTKLTHIDCSRNNIKSLDVSNNTVLTYLNCFESQLTSLDVSNNPLLTELNCNGNWYNIGETCGAYDLKNLPTGFDLSKTSNWQGATLKDDMLTEIKGTVSL